MVRFHEACSQAKDALSKAQIRMKWNFDKAAVSRSFSVGDDVRVLLAVPGSELSARFAGPYEVLGKRGETDYIIKTPGS